MPVVPLNVRRLSVLAMPFLLWICCLLPAITLAAPAVVIKADSTSIPLARHVDILDDPNQTLSPKRILGSMAINEFRPVDLDGGRTLRDYSHHIWIRFSLYNTTDSEKLFWFQANRLAVQHASLYQLGNASITIIPDSPFQDPSSTPILKELRIAPKSTATFLARLETTDNSATDIHLIAPSVYFSRQVIESGNQIFGLGLLTMLSLFALFLAIHYRSQVFFYFAAFLVSMLGVATFGSGVIFTHIPLLSEWKYPIILSFYYLAALSGITGMQHYVNRDRKSDAGKHLPLAQYLALASFLLLMVFFDPFTPLNHLPDILAVIAIADAAFRSYRNHSDLIALTGGILITTTASFFLLLTQAQSGHFGLNLITTPIFLYTIVATGFAICIILVLDEERRQGKELQENQQEETARKVQESSLRILSEISHDIRTPVSGILGMSDLLRHSSLTFSQQEKLDAIRAAGQNLLNRVSEINNRIRLEQQDTAEQRHPFELPLLLENCINGFRLQAENREVELITHIQTDVPAIVTGDESRLRQILIQLIANAIKLTQQGEVVIELSRPASKADTIHFSLRDTGSGEPQNPPDPGLETIGQLLAQMKSELHTSPPAAEGHEVHFDIPLPASLPLSGEKAGNPNEVLARKRLLVVDDNQTCCKVLKQYASSWGMLVKEAYSGNEAIAMYRAMQNINEPFDAIVIDYDMPGLLGTEVAVRIAAENSHPPVMIMLTGLSMAPADELARKSGIQVVLTKPSSERLLQMTLANALQERMETGDAGIPKTHQPFRVLLAEDSATCRNAICKMLENMGIDYKAVSDGNLALDAARKERYDLILMDSNMPNLDGFSATLRIHESQRQKFQRLSPVVELATVVPQQEREQQERRSKAGMEGYLDKPVTKEELEQLIQRYRR